MDVAEYEYVDTLPPSQPLNFRKHSAPDPNIGDRRLTEYSGGQQGEVVANTLVHRASISFSPAEEAGWSKPMDQSDEYSWSVQEFEAPAGLSSNSLEQDYQDIDYTSGSLVSFHTSLSR